MDSEDEEFDEDEKQAEPKDSVSALIMGFAPMKKKPEEAEAPPGQEGEYDTE